MNGNQIYESIRIIPDLDGIFKGCYINVNVPFDIIDKRECFIIVNTLSSISHSMGHWILFYIKDFILYYYDSFGMDPAMYGGDINKFYDEYPYYKIKAINNALQQDSSYVCGCYCITFAHLMAINYNLFRIKSLFSKNKLKNDSYVTNYLYGLVGLKFSCVQNFCTNIMLNQSSCKKYCCCK